MIGYATIGTRDIARVVAFFDALLALACRDPAQVQAVHAKAIALGGKDEGAPGDRGGGFYAAYFRDLDGNKFNAFCMAAS